MNNQPMHQDTLLRWRDEFPILNDTTYLVSNSLGAMPRAVYDSLHAYADTWAARGVRAWGEGWWDMNVARRQPDRRRSSARRPTPSRCTRISRSRRAFCSPASTSTARVTRS